MQRNREGGGKRGKGAGLTVAVDVDGARVERARNADCTADVTGDDTTAEAKDAAVGTLDHLPSASRLRRDGGRSGKQWRQNGQNTHIGLVLELDDGHNGAKDFLLGDGHVVLPVSA